MRQFRYFVYSEQEDLDAGIPNYTGTVTAMNKTDANDQVDRMYPGAYYMYCIL